MTWRMPPGAYPQPGIPNRQLPPYVLNGPGFDPVFNGSHTFGQSTNPMLNLMFARNNYRHYDLMRFADTANMNNFVPDMSYYNSAIAPGVGRASQIFKDALGLNPQGQGYSAQGAQGGGSDRSITKTVGRTAVGAGAGFVIGSALGSPLVGGPIGAAIGGAAGFLSSIF